MAVAAGRTCTKWVEKCSSVMEAVRPNLLGTVLIKMFCAPNVLRTPPGIFGIIFYVLRTQLTILGNIIMFCAPSYPLKIFLAQTRSLRPSSAETALKL